MNKELDQATVFPFGVDLQVRQCHVVETEPYLVPTEKKLNHATDVPAKYHL